MGAVLGWESQAETGSHTAGWGWKEPVGPGCSVQLQLRGQEHPRVWPSWAAKGTGVGQGGTPTPWGLRAAAGSKGWQWRESTIGKGLLGWSQSRRTGRGVCASNLYGDSHPRLHTSQSEPLTTATYSNKWMARVRTQAAVVARGRSACWLPWEHGPGAPRQLHPI